MVPSLGQLGRCRRRLLFPDRRRRLVSIRDAQLEPSSAADDLLPDLAGALGGDGVSATSSGELKPNLKPVLYVLQCKLVGMNSRYERPLHIKKRTYASLSSSGPIEAGINIRPHLLNMYQLRRGGL